MMRLKSLLSLLGAVALLLQAATFAAAGVVVAGEKAAVCAASVAGSNNAPQAPGQSRHAHDQCVVCATADLLPTSRAQDGELAHSFAPTIVARSPANLSSNDLSARNPNSPPRAGPRA